MAKKQNAVTIAGLSLKALLVTTLSILPFGIYVGVLIYGENSLTVLNHLEVKKTLLVKEERALKLQNQKLQKEYFELKQLEAKE